MAEITPAILPKSYEELVEKLDLAAGHVPLIQIDICDGAYVPSRTWPYLKGHDAIFEEIVSQEKALPHWEEVDFEFDLMVKGAYEKIPDFISAGASRIIVHKAAVNDAELQSIIKDFGKHSEELGMFDVELGIALTPNDSVDSIRHIVPNIHFIQVMGIDREGIQGQPFDSKALELIKGLKKAYPDLSLQVDGGVNLDTASGLVEAGADRLVVGSALFGNIDFVGTLKTFESL